ncbi:MAG: cysteine peptidase family C39 domain-containing protein [Bacteroides cellulosilyticus]|nr:cysteine peptidase family C39 domain-containing protein [Bacteroides cellulosilyticus]
MKRKLLSDNPNEILRIICRRFQINYDYFIQEQHKLHPQYPSFRSIAYILNRLGVDSCLIKTDIEELKQLPKPLLIEYDGMFLLLEDITDSEIHIINEKNNTEAQPIGSLNRFWTGTAMVFNVNQRLIIYPVTDKIRMFFNKLMCFITFIVAIFIGGYGVFRYADVFGILNFCYVFTCIIGIIIGVLFQIQEFDRSNPLVNRICHSRQNHGKRDCNSILESADAKFMKLFSWSDFGLLYFIYMISLLIFFMPVDALFLQSLSSIAAAGYIPYSLYYQWKVARKWCTLCLLAQGVLLVNLCLGIIGLYISYGADIDWIKLSVSFLLGGFIVTAFFTTAKVGFKYFIDYKKATKSFIALKYDCSIKSLLLSSQYRIDTTELHKIVLNPEGETILTIIFNTVCNPCISKMRKVMAMFQRKQTIRLELIFLLDNLDVVAMRIARYLLSVYNQAPDTIEPILNDYISHFPGSMNSFGKDDINERCIQDECSQIIAEQDSWCRKNNITSTPQIFLDGYELPDIYTIDDIDYMYE